MSSPLGTALPYGMRDCKLTPYEDEGGTVLGDVSFDLPNMQTFSFSETEEFQDLRGDDRTITTRGRGSQVEWSLEAGGYDITIWSILTGGQIIEEGLTPNRRVIMRKFSTASRRYFRMEGQAISDSGGDVHSIVYRCRSNDAIEGTFADGEFFVTSASGLGLPLLDADFDLLYDHIHNETATSIPLTPVANPSLVAAPVLTLGATTVNSQVLNWAAIPAATDGYQVYESVEGGAFSPVSGARGGQLDSADVTTTITTLTASTDYSWKIVAKKPGSVSSYSNTVSATTPAS